jgi:hypothetical protein
MHAVLFTLLFLQQISANWLFSLDPERICHVRMLHKQLFVNVTQIHTSETRELLRWNVSVNYCAPQACLGTTHGLALLCTNFSDNSALTLIFAHQRPRRLAMSAQMARYDSVFGQLALVRDGVVCHHSWYANTSLGPCRHKIQLPIGRNQPLQDLHIYADRIWLILNGIIYRLQDGILKSLIYTGTNIFPFQFHAQYVALVREPEKQTVDLDRWAFPLISLIELLCLIVVLYRCRCQLFRNGGGVSIVPAGTAQVSPPILKSWRHIKGVGANRLTHN